MLSLKNNPRYHNWSAYAPILIVVLVSLVVGFILVNDYGESWDEQLRYQYATKSLQAYVGDVRSLRDEKGPFYVMLAKLGAQALEPLIPSWHPIDAWHSMHFITFQFSVLMVYTLCLRLVSRRAALGTAILFETQPLLWGHAFINPKDIPFMAFFLGSIVLGIGMSDRYATRHLAELTPDLRAVFLHEWRTKSGQQRRRVRFLSGLPILILVGLIAATPFLNQVFTTLIRQAYTAGTDTLLGKVFINLAPHANSIPLKNYVHKAMVIYRRGIWAYFFMAAVWHVILLWRNFPQAANRVHPRSGGPFWRLFRSAWMDWRVLAAGIMLGLSTSIRTLGPAAGGLVVFYLWRKTGRRAVPVALVYLIIAAAAAVLAWPWLWENPASHFFRSFSLASDYEWEGKVMFQGIDHAVGDLPPGYLPTLLSLQFTEPVLILFSLGLILTAVYARRFKTRSDLLILAAMWFFIPVLGVVLLRPTIYDNFRHFLFITPAMFLFASLGLDFILKRLNPAAIQWIFIGLLLIPGLYWLVRLHPYQYVYYNAITGNVRGAFRSYEMDYWATSYRAAIEKLNDLAEPGSTVVVWGPDHIVADFANPDLRIVEYPYEDYETAPGDVFAILSTRHDKDLSLFTEAPVVLTIERAGARFAVVKQIHSNQDPQP